jgi:hypothetical protein
MDERRSSKRISVSFRSQFTPLFSGRKEATVTEVSTQGCRVETSFKVPVNTYVELRLQVSPTELPLVIELAAVRWVGRNQLGIEFLGLQSNQRTRLDNAINQAVGHERNLLNNRTL